MIFDGFAHQLPDIDPSETDEWLFSLDQVVDRLGRPRASYLLARLLERARETGVGIPASVSTPYVNTIPAEHEPWFPGDEMLERQIRRYIRWNAAIMVVRANKHFDGIGGHLSTYASSAALYEVGFNHFFRGKDDGRPRDAIYIQGHAAPGIYARAFLEGRLGAEQLDSYRREVGGHGSGLSSYPHPRLMPEFWEFPTVSMGLGPLNAVHHAKFLRYLQLRKIDDTSEQRVWAFLGDGEMDEPEAIAAVAAAGRERLDNLIFVVNCNLQRLDGPVRGNHKIIQEFESLYRGAGWNVIKVVWGTRWDELLARDVDGVLLNKMNTTVDGEFQKYGTSDGAHIREHFFGPDPRLRAMVEHLSDEDLISLPRGGHDYRKLYAAYKTAVEQAGAPTVILAKTIKGWTLGTGLEGRNATHQIKKMTKAQLKELRDRLHLTEVLPDEALDADDPPYLLPPEDSDVMRYLRQRRRELDGPLPKRSVTTRRPLTLPSDGVYTEFREGSGGQAVSTTMVFTKLLRNLMRDGGFGRRVVPIIPDEARTFGMDPLFTEFGIHSALGQRYEPVDAALPLHYKEATDGQLLEEGISEAGAIASFTAAGTSYATTGVPMVPFYTYYSMFGFQRVGDFIWAAADARARGFLMGATAGRTTLTGEGLQHCDGHSPVLFSTVPSVQAYDPAFAYELAAIIRQGINRMYGTTKAEAETLPFDATPDPSEAAVAAAAPESPWERDDPDVIFYITLYNENYPMPPRPDDVDDHDIVCGLYRFAAAPDGPSRQVRVLFSGSAHTAAREAAKLLAEQHDVAAELWSVTSYKNLREDALAVERWNRLHPRAEPHVPFVTRRLDGDAPIIAVTDYMKAVPDMIGRFVQAPFVPLGTDGFGRSDLRSALRAHFEIDAAQIVVAALSALCRQGAADPGEVEKAMDTYAVNAAAVDPLWA